MTLNDHIALYYKVLELKNSNKYSWKQISEKLNCNETFIRRLYEEGVADLRKEVCKDLVKEISAKREMMAGKNYMTVQEKYHLKNWEIERIVKEIDSELDFEKKFKSDKTKITILSDLHIPFIDSKEIDSIIKKEYDPLYQKNICIIGGDLLDLPTFSKFVDHTDTNLVSDLSIAIELIFKLSAIFDSVIMISGNHDTRLHKKLSTILPTNIIKDWTDPLALITKGTLGDKMSNVWYPSNMTKWKVRVGSVLVAHPERYYGSSPLNTAYKFATSKVTEKDIEAIVVTHTHGCGISWDSAHKYLLVETGCLTTKDALEYTASPRTFLRPPQRGYATLVIDDKGKLVPSEIRLYSLGFVTFEADDMLDKI